jgi:peptidylprolyl isomerase
MTRCQRGSKTTKWKRCRAAKRNILCFVFLTLTFLLSSIEVHAQNTEQNTIYLDTKDGRIVIRLRADLAPQHAERIKTLTREKFYNDVPFHRVVDGFMAQTGDGQYGNGTGGSRYPNLPAEFSNAPFKRGVVGMARKGGDNNSANSQFFIMFADAPSLNGQYTVIGEVVSGMDVVDKIKKGSPAQNGAVSNPDKIMRMQVAADALSWATDWRTLDPYSLWDWQGSQISLLTNGSSWWFFYRVPNPFLISVGVPPGALFFHGEAEGNRYSGTAYVYSKCGRHAAAVTGEISGDGRTITFVGKFPLVRDNCEPFYYSESTLVLILLSHLKLGKSDRLTSEKTPSEPIHRNPKKKGRKFDSAYGFISQPDAYLLTAVVLGFIAIFGVIIHLIQTRPPKVSAAAESNTSESPPQPRDMPLCSEDISTQTTREVSTAEHQLSAEFPSKPNEIPRSPFDRS